MKKTTDKRLGKALSSALPWLAVLIPAALGTFLYFYAGSHKAFANWYAHQIYPVWVGTVGRVFGWLPFSVNEFGIYALILLGIFWIVRDITRVTGHRQKKNWAGRWLRTILAAAGSMWLIFMLGCGINYNRSTFAEEYTLDLSGGTKEELYYLTQIMVERVNGLADSVTRDGEGVMQVEADYKEQAVKAMRELGEEYDILKGFYPQPKAVFFSEFLSHEHICGVHSPYTSEAQYNRLITPYNIPHTICHELSHLKGFMREDEANFVGYLACVSSEDKSFQYSGYCLGYIYVSNALYTVDYDHWDEQRLLLCDAVSKDLSENSIYWSRYQTKLAEIKQTVNDNYLKFNHQEDGVKSYGRVVDLLLAYYRNEITERMLTDGK